MSISDGHITAILNAFKGDFVENIDQVYLILYDELRKHARKLMRDERKDHTLQPTAVVNEAWIVLRGSKILQINDRKHFFRLAAQIMERLLVNYAVKRNAEKRDGGQRVTLSDKLGLPAKEERLDIVELHEALNEFAVKHSREAQVVRQKFFAGNSIEEIASILDIAESTVKRDWDFAQGWLFRRLSSS